MCSRIRDDVMILHNYIVQSEGRDDGEMDEELEMQLTPNSQPCCNLRTSLKSVQITGGLKGAETL